MNWIESLYRTFESNSRHVGNQSDAVPLVPVAHTAQNSHIVISIDQNGDLLDAKASALLTIIPCTESSAGRTSSPVPHPLVDKLKYIASDYYDLTGTKKPKPSKNGSKKTHYELYFDAINSWANSAQGDARLSAIIKYLENIKGRVLTDLCAHGIYQIVDGKIPKTWKGDKDTKPEIYEITKNSPAPWDAFVRWEVNIPGVLENRTYRDQNLWKKWEDHYLETPSRTGLCYVTGEESRLASSHPKKIRNVADGAKLISANDSSGFTFRGRFTDKEGTQTFGVSFDVTQKAHNALRWLIARQGKRFGDQAIVAWAITGTKIPDALASTIDLMDDEDFLNAGLKQSKTSDFEAETGQGVALALKQKLSGYHSELGDTTDIVILAVDSATPGRMAISYYRELTSSDFLERIETWHSGTAWKQYFGKDKQFIGAPSPLDIAQSAFGSRLDEKLKAATYRRLLPCIIENRPIPVDLVACCVRRATARQGMEHWEWEKALGIACALYRKQQIQSNEHHHTMSLERNRTTRSYLYGRLLAVADVLEQATYSKDEKRTTHAARSMQIFADQPFKTWANIEKALVPYKRTLAANKPDLLRYFDNEIREIMESFSSAEEFRKADNLNGEFLLAYHCQRTALWKGN